MWQVFLDLLAAARRPLVFVDTETAGLGLPPVEVAALVWAPWVDPVSDETTDNARAACPPGLTYATTMRLHPGMPIQPGATRVHGIMDADVRGCPRFDDLEVRAMFGAWATGDAGEGEGPAVWGGHNVAEADLPWMMSWKYLPSWPGDLGIVDTLRVARRLAKEHPYPLAIDLLDGLAPSVPAIGLGLDVFAGTLSGLHVALFGGRPPAAHGALPDAIASARCFARALELWGPLWPTHKGLDGLLAALNTPEPGRVAWDGWLRDEGEGLRWARGKFAGQVVHRDAYVLGLPRAPTGDPRASWWCADATRAVLEKARPLAVAR